MSETLKETGRIVAGAYYDFQQIRLAELNRIRDIIRKKVEDIPFDAVEDKKEEKEYSEKYKDEVLLDTLQLLRDEGKVDEKEEKYLKRTLELAFETEKTEKKYMRLMEEYIASEEVWMKFLDHVRGIGKILATNLIKEFGYCERYNHVSSLWKHCGQDVVDGKSPKRKKGETISYNPKLKTLVWKISDCLMKLNFEFVEKEDGTKEKIAGFYRTIYDNEKARQLSREYQPGELKAKFNGYKEEDVKLSLGHAHSRALRKMRKIFLEHYYVCTRQIKGLPVSKPYQFENVASDGIIHDTYYSWQDALKRIEA